MTSGIRANFILEVQTVAKKVKKPLLILAAATMVNLTLGVLYSWSVISKNLTAENIGWSNSEASLPYTVAIVVFAIALLVAGILQDKMGPKKFVIAGITLVGLGLLTSGFFGENRSLMLLTYGVLVGTGIGFGYSCVTPAAMKWFHRDYKGVITGIVVAGFGVASVYVAPVTSWLISWVGVFDTFKILGVYVLVVGLPVAMLITNPPAGYVAEPPALKAGQEPKAKVQPWNYDWKEMIRTKQFWILWIMFALASSAGLLVIGNVSKIAQVQADYAAGFTLVMLLAVFNAGGRIGGGMLSDRIGRIRTLQIVVLLALVNMLLFAFYGSVLLMVVGTAVAGIGYGALLSIFPAFTSDYYGMKNFGTNYGVLYTAWGIAGAIGPVIASAVVDATGSYNGSYYISAGLLLFTLILSFLLVPIRGKKKA